MTNRGNRRGGQPLFIKGETVLALKRTPLDTKTFNEAWIQNLIHKNPGMLPLEEIESGFTPAIPIGREVPTTSGYIDNLFISPEGFLTIVETKLWRNPEARREVVGQIIDYAKVISKWTFTDLDNSVKQFNRKYNNNSDGLLETIKKLQELDEGEEHYFIDNITKNLKRGRFLLLIVGDGIRESVEDMIEYLTQTPQLYFTLALVELQVYKMNSEDNSMIVIPQLVTRTREITRAIVRIEGNSSAEIKVNIETDLGTETNTSQQVYRKLTITAQDFFDQLEQNTNKESVDFVQQILKNFEELGLVVEWNTGSVGVKLPDPSGSGIKIGVFTIDKSGKFYLGYSKSQFEKLAIPLEVSYAFCSDTASMLPGITQNPITKNSWNKYSSLQDLKPVYERFMVRVNQYIEEIRIAGEKLML